MNNDGNPPPWWFVPALIGGMASAVALASMAVALGS